MNKRKLPAREFCAYNDGDVLAFGESSRIYVLHNPGQRAWTASEGKREAHRQPVEGPPDNMYADSPSAGGDVDEGACACADDAEVYKQITYDDDDNFDWKSYTGPLNEKQRKAIEKIRLKEEKLQNLNREIRAIQAKRHSSNDGRRFDEPDGDGLSDGQRAQIIRNTERADVLQEQLVDMLDALEESIKDSLAGRNRGGDAIGGHRSGGHGAPSSRRRKRADSDDDDDFYDRTGGAQTKRKTMHGNDGVSTAGDEGEGVETVETLWRKRLEAEEELRALQEERRRIGAAGGSAAPPAAGGENGNDDELDAYMRAVETKVGEEHVQVLADRVKEAEDKIRRIGRLVDIADPDGIYRPKRRDGHASRSGGAQRHRPVAPTFESGTIAAAKRMQQQRLRREETESAR